MSATSFQPKMLIDEQQPWSKINSSKKKTKKLTQTANKIQGWKADTRILYKNAAALKTAKRIHYNIKRKGIVIGFPSSSSSSAVFVDLSENVIWPKSAWATNAIRKKKHSFSALYRIMACVNGGNMVWRRRRRKMQKRIKKFCFEAGGAREIAIKKSYDIKWQPFFGFFRSSCRFRWGGRNNIQIMGIASNTSSLFLLFSSAFNSVKCEWPYSA